MECEKNTFLFVISKENTMTQSNQPSKNPQPNPTKKIENKDTSKVPGKK
jgi:hypothetical protein